MAQAGMYVAASEFKFHPYNYIFSRIHNNDNIFKGESSFAVEMSELRSILKEVMIKVLSLGMNYVLEQKAFLLNQYLLQVLLNYQKEKLISFLLHICMNYVIFHK